MNKVEEFNSYRQKMNDRILGQDNKVLKRFFSLDNQTYQASICIPHTRRAVEYWDALEEASS